MRSTISPDCATARRSLHDQLPGDGRAKRSAALGCPQGSPVPQVQSHVSKHVVRRADLFSLQDFEGMAERCAAQVLSFQQLTLEVRRQAGWRHTSTEEPEDMNRSNRGMKHVCPKCESKYYDLKMPVVACPICGAKPPAARLPRAAQPARKIARTTFGRYP